MRRADVTLLALPAEGSLEALCVQRERTGKLPREPRQRTVCRGEGAALPGR